MKQSSFFLILFFCVNFFSFCQSNQHDSWIIKFDKNVYVPLTENESNHIKSAYGNETFNRIVSVKALEINIKDVLRNRVKVLVKKYNSGESLPKLSSISESNMSTNFNHKNFNPLIYDFDFESKQSQIFRVDGTDYVINIIPKKLK